MPDAIEGALYYDWVFGLKCICLAVGTDEDGDPVAIIRYEDKESAIPIDLELFRDEDSIELMRHPYE